MNDTAPLLVSETEDRYSLIALDIVRRDSGEVESTTVLSRDEIDMPGYVESVERGYDNTAWKPVRVYRSHVSPAALESVVAYVGLVEKIHAVYREVQMDTEEDRALHARHVENADRALALVKERLNLP